MKNVIFRRFFYFLLVQLLFLSSFPLYSLASFTQEQKLTASDGVAGDTFGVPVSVSADGTRFVVGASAAQIGANSGQGAAYVFSRSGTTWTQEQKLTASDGVGDDGFGKSVAISPDGARITVGATGVNSNQGAGYAFSRSGTTWTESQKLTASDGVSLDYFGSSVSFSSDNTHMAVGAVGWGPSGSSNNQGAVYVFSRSGSTWTEEQRITVADGVTNDFFGSSSSFSSDASRVLVGASNVNSSQGATYVFSRSGTTWTQEQKLTASDGSTNDFFAISTVISEDGLRVGAGATGANSGQGAAYVFSRSGTTWTQEQKLTASDGAASNLLGNSISFSYDATKVAVGTGYGTTANNSKGASYIFSRSGTTWTESQKLTASDGVTDDLFGYSLSFSSDGQHLALGAAGFNSFQGATYVYNVPITLPTLTTSSASSVAPTAATLNGTLTATGGADASERGFNYGLDTSYGATLAQASGPYSTGAFTGLLNGLVCNTTYHFRAYAINTAGTGYGSDMSFKTSPCPEHHSGGGGGSAPAAPAFVNDIPVVAICALGQKFSSATGLPCSSFSESIPLQSLPIATVVSQCLISTTLKMGNIGTQVKCLQTLLQLISDGIFGPKTKAAVILFQKSHQLVGDGIVGPKTIQVLGAQ